MTADASLTGAKPDHDPLQRNAARLAAVQALYQIEATQNPPEQVIKDFLIGRTGGVGMVENENAQESLVHLPEIDSELFINIVRAVQNRGDDIDNMIKSSVSAEWPAERLEMTLRAILRAGIAELLERTDIPPGATITAMDPSEGDIPSLSRSGNDNGNTGESRMVTLGQNETRTVSYTVQLPSGPLGSLDLRHTPTASDTPVTIDPSCDPFLAGFAE